MREVVDGRFSFGRFVMAVWLFFLVGTVLFVFGVAALSVTPKNPDHDGFPRYAAGGASVAFGFAALGYCAVQFFGRTRQLHVRPDGMSWVKGGRPGSATWADVREVYRDDSFQVMAPNQKPSEWMRRAHVRVVFQDGTRVVFRQTLANYDAVAHAVQIYAAEALLPTKLAEVAATGAAAFGPVGVLKEGVRIKGGLRPWEAVNYCASEGWLFVAPAQDEFNIEDRKDERLSAIPNYVVLFVVMARVGKPAADPKLMYPRSWRERMGGRI